MKFTRLPGKSNHRADYAVLYANSWYSVSSLTDRTIDNPVKLLAAITTEPVISGRVTRRLDEVTALRVDLAHAPTLADRRLPIWGAGLNYRGHSKDLAAAQPSDGPGSYLRPATCLIDNGETIMLPPQSSRVTAEAELGLILGQSCKNVKRSDWRSAVAAVTVVLDLTAEDAIRKNPRHIPWAKGFDSFCSIGPVLVALADLSDDQLMSLTVSTRLNGETVASAPVADMKYDCGFLVEYFTAGRTLPAGTVICTGTPGAAPLADGDVVTATVDGVGELSHPIRAGAIDRG